MGHVFEVVLQAIEFGIIINNIFHIWDGNESESPDDVADVFENNFLVDIAGNQVNNLTWESITVTPLDVANPADPIVRIVSIGGSLATDPMQTGAHIYVKLISDDNGFKSGGKMIAGLSEDQATDGQLLGATINNFQTIFDDLITDLVAAGLSLAIYRPTLSVPGLPQISVSSATVVRGIATNNRRQRPFQNQRPRTYFYGVFFRGLYYI